MYFQIENTPENERKRRRRKSIPKESPKEECPRLILAPFSRPPQVVFDNVLVGSTSERSLEVFNPSKQFQQITLSKSLPPGLLIKLPGEYLEVEPETCYCLSMMWSPTQPTAIRETIRFTTENRGRYDVIVVMKSVVNVKGKIQPKGFKISPGKKKKKSVSKKSPVSIYKKKSEIIYNTKQKMSVNIVQRDVYQTFDKENITRDDYSINSYADSKGLFDSSTNNDVYFNTSEIFSNVRKTNALQETYDKSYNINNGNINVSPNVLKPSNKQNNSLSPADIFDNLAFTPLKNIPNKMVKLDKGPQIILSHNSDSELEQSSDFKLGNQENETHTIISITSTQPPNKWLHTHIENQHNILETPTMHNKRHPNTSSPKELNSPNFSINTDVSRISDHSFFPQRFSTERKYYPFKNETQEILEKVGSDTYTKDSPLEHNFCHFNMERPPHYFNRDQPKMCRQSLFRDDRHFGEAYDKNELNSHEDKKLQNDLKSDVKSPVRSIAASLKSIPEESTQLSDIQVYDKTCKGMSTFTLDRTYDKHSEKTFLSTSTRQTWSKKAIRVEPDLWKVPTVITKKCTNPKSVAKSKETIGSGITNDTFESNKSINQNVTLNQIGNIYSQSATVDPFLSSTYFYDEDAVNKFEVEFKRWLNCILTPPADLDSNVEQKIDVGKAWIENRNKEVPLAPTKEQVCSAYHNSHRLERLRRSARNLLFSPEIAQVFLKLNSQIDKKLIAIRTDRNLHLDVGLQKIIMELLLSYNPLWLRIGLEAIYGLVLPLRSNSDVEGLTTFIIQRMFKNPHLKNKHSKSSAPNMLLPAYMEAIKKYTLKKFFMLVFFLDQAKQKKLISHDPCLFCRNAICKESREIIIRFTRELIAGIGDITKHLRPLGYVVSHKQSYLDEYKYAVHNIALDIRDGVRLTKVMEIILMKNGLINHLRTPAISRLQKIHNVQVALNALKEANFVIVGDITAIDIADGHREKTLSLLWQIIHVFRAPLFEKAANIIQGWWRKKFEVIVEKRKEEEKARLRLSNAVSVIQWWWRRIQYNRQVEWRMQQITKATIVVQKYCRMWLCRTRLRRFKTSVLKIEEWFRSIKLMRKAKTTLQIMRTEKERLRQKCATIIQSHVRRWLCIKHYEITIKKIVKVQSLVRGFLVKNRYIKLKKAVIYAQQKYRGKLNMRQEMQKYAKLKQSVIIIQSYYKMIRQRRMYLKLKKTIQIVEDRYIAIIKMKNERRKYLQLQRAVVTVQALYRGKKCREKYVQTRNSIIFLQRKVRAHQLMKIEQNSFFTLRLATICLQRQYRAQLKMKKCRENFLKLRKAALAVQRRYRSLKIMQKQRSYYLKLRESAINIQNVYRAYVAGKQQRKYYLKQKEAVIKIQQWYRSCKKAQEIKQQYKKSKEACVTIQRYYKAYIIGRQIRQEYVRIRTATLCIQRFYRSYIETKTIRREYIKIKTSTISIQKFYRSYLESKKQREEYLKMKSAISCIETAYIRHKKYQLARQTYLQLQKVTLNVQRRYRSLIAMRQQRKEYLKLKKSVLLIQQKYRALTSMRVERKSYLKLRFAIVTIQTRYRAQCQMRQERLRYLIVRKACVCIQRSYRAYVLGKRQRHEFLKLKESSLVLQRRYKALLAMRKDKSEYITKRAAAITIQRRLRANNLMLATRKEYIKMKKACQTIQCTFRAFVAGKRQRSEYMKIKSSVILIQTRFRMLMETKRVRGEYLQLRSAAILIQREFRAHKLRVSIRRLIASKIIQNWYRAVQKRNVCRREFLRLRRHVITVQSIIRMYILRKRFIKTKTAALQIQQYYRSYKIALQERYNYMRYRQSVIKLQSFVKTYFARKRFLRLRAAVLTIQAAYKLFRFNRQRKEAAATVIQKYVRRYLVQSWYRHYHQKVVYVQKLWRGVLTTRHIRNEYLLKKSIIIKIQSIARGYLVRKEVTLKKEQIIQMREEKRKHWAASKIQALFRGHRARLRTSHNPRCAELRRRWREGALHSTQETISERNKHALDVLRNMYNIDSVLEAFQILELTTEVFPNMYIHNAAAIVRRVFVYLTVTNRSISSIELLKSGSAILVNFARYKNTGPKIYVRDYIASILKFMLRFSNSEKQLFCILSTTLFLFSKYEDTRKDLTEFLHIPENQKMMVAIKSNVDRMMRIAMNTKKKFHTPQLWKSSSHKNNSVNYSICSSSSDMVVMPALDPDYGIKRIDRPKYFEDASQAINCLFRTYNL